MLMKRVNYFKGEFLNKDDFEEEQTYHRNMLREHNKNLHSWGIADGLDVSEAGSAKVTITSGMAIDAEGNQIILVVDTPKQVPDGLEYYLTISYHDEPSDLRDDNPGEAQFSRIEEKPLIEFLRTSESFDKSIKLILAKITLDKEKITIDKSKRQYVRIKIDADKTNLSGPLVVSGNVGIGTTNPSAKLNIDPQGKGGIVIGNPNTVSGGYTSLITEISAQSDGYSSIQSIRKSGSQWGDISLNPNGGNVGIGTTNPKDKLDVNGNIGLSGRSAFEGYDNYLRINDKNEFPSGTTFPYRAHFYRGITTGNWYNEEPGLGNILVDGQVGIGTKTPSVSLDVPRGGKFNSIAIGADPHGKLPFDPYEVIQLPATHNLRIFFGTTETVDFLNNGNAIIKGSLEANGTVKAAKFVGDGSGLTGIKTGQWTDIEGGISYNNGNVGIGTTKPGWPLSIRAIGGNEELISFENPSGITKWHINQNLGGKQGLNFVETGVADGRLYLQAGGNVGIGTATPSAKLEVNGDIKAKAIESKPVLHDFKVDGKKEEFYPVFFRDDNWAEGPLILEINRPNVHTDSEWRGSLISKFTVHSSNWGHGADICRAELYDSGTQFIAGYQNDPYRGRFVVWLRGGGTTYYFRSNHFAALEDFSATEKKYKINEKDEIVFKIKTSVDNNVLYNAIHFDRSLIIDGNVGIGTSYPSEKFEVNGTVKAAKFVGDGSGLTGITGTNKTQWTDVEGGISYNNKIGIGTTDMKRPLHVEGSEIHSGGPGAGFSFASRSTNSFVDSPGQGERWVWYSTGKPGSAFLWSGRNLMSIDKDGNVGVGTDKPAGKLDVRGDIKAGNSDLYFTKVDHDHSGFGNTAGYAAIENAANFEALMILGRSGTPKGRYVRLWDYLQINGGMDVTGKVGIGTTNPGWPLSIRAIGGNEELISFENPSGTTKWHINQNLGGKQGLNFVETGVADGRLYLQAGGNVGIGTTSPSARLDVIGNIKGSNDLIIAGNVGVGTDKPAGKLDVIRADGVAIRALSNSENSFTGYQLGRTSAESSWGVAAKAGNWASDAVPGDVILRTEKPSQKLLFTTNSGRQSDLVISNGNVGIGTTAPTEKLEVNGTVKAAKFVGDGSGLTGITGTGANKTPWTDVAGGIFYNNKVGIGTTNPQRSLHLYNDNGNCLVLQNPKGGNGATVNLDFQTYDVKAQLSPTASVRAIDDNWSSNLVFLTKEPGKDENGLKERLRITKDGKVGIGTDSPVGKLDVRGDIHAGNSDLYFTKVDHDHSGFANTAGYAAIENAANYDALMIMGRSGTPKGRYVRLWDYLQINGGMDVTGKVGIGTTNPGWPLSIRAIGGNEELISFENPSGTTKWHINQNLGGKQGLNFVETGVADGRLYLQAGGNVGIGTITPSAKLEVNGDLKVNGKIIQEDWKNANLTNGWKIFREADKVHNYPSYFIDKSGIVHLVGAVYGGELGKPIFNLPEGYRPAKWELQTVLTYPDTSGRCDIMPDGNVILTKGDKGWVFLDGITFRAANR